MLSMLMLQSFIFAKGDKVRSLKESKAPENDVNAAVKELKAVKKILEDKVSLITIFLIKFVIIYTDECYF